MSSDESCVEYVGSHGRIYWKVPVRNILLLAEYTTPGGPFAEDYFLVFIFAENQEPRFATASFYSDGRDEVLTALSKQWGTPADLALASSTDWKSRVVWPPEIEGMEYLVYDGGERRPGAEITTFIETKAAAS